MEYNIQVENLSKSYQNFKLENVNFQLPKGSIMGFIGENGAGKTTTLKLILNLIKKDSGSVKIFGFDLSESEKEIFENIGVVFDESNFHDHLTALNISEIMRNIYKNWDETEYQKYLTKFKLPEKKVVKEFSRGMKMKLSIAVALSHHSKILILDEATSGLDPVVRNEILDIFLDFIQDEQNSILFSSHITSDLEKVCDYITLIHDGKILFSDSKDNLIYQYGIIKCGTEEFTDIDRADIIGYRKGMFGYEILIKNYDLIKRKYSKFVIDRPNIEEIMMFYVRSEKE